MLEMIRISKNGYSWADIWIPEGCFGIYEKKYRQQGYDVKKTLVKKETELERKSTMNKFNFIVGSKRENLLMESAMRIQEIFDDMCAAELLDSDRIDSIDSIERFQTFCELAREFENTFYGTDEYEDFIGLTDKWVTKKLTELFGVKGEQTMGDEGHIVEIEDERGGTYCEFISKNGITYDLLRGVSIGRKRTYKSDYVFIMLNTFCSDNDICMKLDHLMGGYTTMIVDFLAVCSLDEWFSDPDCMKDDENVIREFINYFEEDNMELIDFIKTNNIPTSPTEYENINKGE